MGNFFITVSSPHSQGETKRVFRTGLELARHLKSQSPSGVVDVGWACAASFHRANGSGSTIVHNKETGSWLLATGSWFHDEDFGVGAESRLLRRYLEVGPTRLANELEGFFVLVIGDARNGEVVVITDLVGSCHCFVRSVHNTIAVSGSSLVLAGLDSSTLDPIGCQEFLYTGVSYEDRTIYQEVRKLGPASVYWFADGALKKEQRYWKITDLNPNALDAKTTVKVLWDRLTHAAKRVGKHFERPVCDLTGGYDSRAMVAAFRGMGIKFWTTVSGGEHTPDVVISRGLAARAGFPHIHNQTGPITFEKVKQALPLTDGEYNLVGYASVLDIHQKLSSRFDISVNGSFGEVGRGYWWELLWPYLGRIKQVDAHKLAQTRYAAHGYDSSLFPPEIRLNPILNLAGVIKRTNEGLGDFPNTMQMDHAYLMVRMQRWQGRIASSTDQLWPCLSPFLFRSVLETMLQAGAHLRRRSLLIRMLLSEFQPKLAEYPLENGSPPLPLTWRNALRFSSLPLHYGGKILKKVSRLTCGMLGNPCRVPNSKSMLDLWRNEEIKDILQPRVMKAGSLMERTALEGFLHRSLQPNFLLTEQWERLLTLEYTLQVLKGSTPILNR